MATGHTFGAMADRAIDEVAANVAEATGEDAVGIAPIIITLITAFLPMLAQPLPCLNPKPEPPVPQPNPTPAEQLAWSNAWRLKGRAEAAFLEDTHDYNSHTVRQMSKRIGKQKRRDGEPVSKATATELAIQALDAAREKPMEELHAAIMDAQGS